MPKTPTYPVLFEECKTISLKQLKAKGYIREGEIKSGNLTWYIGDNKDGWISFTVNMACTIPCIELNYRANGCPVKYKIQIVSTPSNIRRGKIFYFLCPVTGNRCRKLFLVGKRFLHRRAFIGCYYEQQTFSKKNRSLFHSFQIIKLREMAVESIHQKHFKKFYNSKPTKKYITALMKFSLNK